MFPFKALFFLYDILILAPKSMLDLAFPIFIVDHLLFEKLVVLEDFFVLFSFLLKFLFFLEELFELGLLKVRFGDFIVEKTDFSVVFDDVFLKDINWVVNVSDLAFAEKFRIFLMKLDGGFRIVAFEILLTDFIGIVGVRIVIEMGILIVVVGLSLVRNRLEVLHGS